MLTQERLKELMTYCENTGIFTNKVARGNRIKVGESPTYQDKNGYFHARLDWKLYSLHRLAWLYVHGSFPPNFIDHINGNKSDNRLCNLREATQAQNTQNQRRPRKDNTSGYLGVTKCKDRKGDLWVAQVQLNGKMAYSSVHKTPLEAHEAYVDAKRKLHEYCTI